MEIILVKTTTCAKCRQLQPIFEKYCEDNNIKRRIICYDTADADDRRLVEDMKIEAVPTLIFIENDFKKPYSDITNLDGIVSAKNEFLASKGV